MPEIKLSSFYNNHLTSEVKEGIVKAVTEEGEQLLGMSMTYTLIEWAKENMETLLEKQPGTILYLTRYLYSTYCDSSLFHNLFHILYKKRLVIHFEPF